MLSYYLNKNYRIPILEVYKSIKNKEVDELLGICIEISQEYEKVFMKFDDEIILTSKIIGILVNINEEIERRGKTFHVFGISEKNYRLFDLMSLTTYLNISNSNELSA